MKHIKIANKKVGLKYPPFLIAEAGINHKGNLKRALKMIEVAKKAGVDAVKFQTFKADEFISNKKKNLRAEILDFRMYSQATQLVQTCIF